MLVYTISSLKWQLHVNEEQFGIDVDDYITNLMVKGKEYQMKPQKCISCYHFFGITIKEFVLKVYVYIASM